MKKVIIFLAVLIFLAGCRSEATEPYILDQEEFEVPESKYSKTTEVHKLRYRSDELKVTGYMVKPKDRNEDLPLLIYARGGNQDYGMMTEEFLSKYLSFWANKGYVVLTTQYRGVDGGEGKEEYGGADVQDVLNLTQVAKELDGVNTDRTFLLGESRGGMMAYLAIKEGINVQAAASVNGSVDLFAAFEERGPEMKRMLNELVGTPSEEEQAYKDRSAIYWPEKLNVPLLLLHGDQDWRVSVDHSRELAKKLKALDQEVKYVEYEGGEHGLKGHFDAYTNEIDEWFQTH